MRLPLLPHRVMKASGPRCVVCHDLINGGPKVRIRGMYFHRHCASYRVRMDRAHR